MHVRTDRLFRVLPALLASLGVVAVAAPRAHAAAYTYGTRQRTINAGVLVVDDAGSGALYNGYSVDNDPYVFYILNQRQDLKPFGWNIVNPIAPATVTGDILQTWDARSGPNAYALNQTVTPSMGAYWEVSLSKTSLTDLEKFNVLLLNIPATQTGINFTDNEVQDLRRYVDNGGQLWVEGTGGTINATDSLFLNVSFTTAQNTGGRFLPGVNAPLPTGYLGLRQPIVQTPYLLTPQELDSLGLGGAGSATYGITGASGTLDTSILSTVAETSAYPVISAGQYGAGQVIVDSVGSALDINKSVANSDPNIGPYCDSTPSAALTVPAADLKFAYNILSWSTAHPSEYKTSHQSNQSPASLGPALTPTWRSLLSVPTTGTTPGAAINGSFVYVRTADGVLRAFNATPGTDIIGTGNPDAGFPDYADGTPYDEIWDTGGTTDGFPGISTQALTDVNASAPTVAAVPPSGAVPGKTDVFIERSDGKVYAIDATTGVPGFTFGGVGGTFPGIAPAPTYYGGFVYAAEADGSLYVYDLATNTGADYTLYGSGYTPPTDEHPTAPPTVGLVRETVNQGNASAQAGNGYVDDIVVTVTTNYRTYTIHAGARHDPLALNSGLYTPVQANPSGFFSLLPVGVSPTYNDNGGGYQVPAGGTGGGTGFSFATPPGLPVFGDYDVDFGATAAGEAVRGVFGTGAFYGAPATGNVASGVVSAPALDSNGNFYYSANVPAALGMDSTLVCAHDGRSGEAAPSGRLGATEMLWRFRLPFAGTGELDPPDADGISYNALAGFQFVGAPVVDDQGNVFALASGTTGTGVVETAVLCFNATYSPYIQAPVTNANGTVNITQITQPVPTAAAPASGPDEFGNPVPQAILAGSRQFNGLVDSNGQMTIQNFAGVSQGANGQDGQIAVPDLSEPQPVQATYTQSSAGGTSTSTVTGTMHTNLNWYAILPPNLGLRPGAGMTLQGDNLFFPGATPQGDTLNRLYAYPQSAGLVGGGRVYNAAGNVNGRPAFTVAATPQVGALNGVLSAGGGVLIANGTNGVAAYGTKYTLVADAGRVLEVDSDGVASWLVDSTAEINPATGLTTHVALNHPTAITQVTPNDYLVADTGNNRCVRFDRAGNVLWELSRFNDAPLETSNGTPIPFYKSGGGVSATKGAALLAPGEPLTLNHPTSVTSYVQTINDTSGNLAYTVVHYLIADTGNSRIVEVVDAFDNTGASVGVPHDLVWVSRTSDALGRHYAYTSANYFDGPNGLSYIVALVTNRQVAQVSAAGSMDPTSDDGPGSSIVRLDYAPAPLPVPPSRVNVNGQADGYISRVVTSFLAYLKPSGIFDLADSPVLEQTGYNPPTYQHATPPASLTPTAISLRNPRFLQPYTPPGSTATTPQAQDFLLADDTGVWDLFPNVNGQLEAQWGFQGEVQVSGNVTSGVNGTYLPNDGVGDCAYLLNGNPNGYGLYYDTASSLWGVYTSSGGYHGTLIVAESAAPVSTLDPSGAYGTTFVSRLPFLPNSLQRIGSDPITINGTNYLLGHYLIANGYSQGEVTPNTGFGGEVLELGDLSQTALQTNLLSSFSRLGGVTAPLSQPTFATQEK